MLILTLLGSLLLLSAAGFAEQNRPAQDSPEVAQLKEKAQSAFVKGDYAAAAKFNLEIAEKHPDSPARRYSVQMLGTIYEADLVDIQKAIKWDREYLDKYANSRQVPSYRARLARLQTLSNPGQEQAFKSYQSILAAQDSDEVLVKKLEALVKEYPDFLRKDDALHDLALAYGRMDESKKSALAYKAMSSANISPSDKASSEDESRYWRMRTTWAWAAWAVIGMLWGVVLLMKPWQRLTWSRAKKFLLWPVLWLLLTAASMPLFFSMETEGYPIQISLTVVLAASGLNLIVLFWLLLLLHGQPWLTRPTLLRWLSPVFTLMMTTCMFFLFVVYQPNGPYTIDVCIVKYDYWRSELANNGVLYYLHHGVSSPVNEDR